MKKILVISCLLCSFQLCSWAQNVGIGTNTPTQKLDVNGNVNVNGNITVNGIAGVSGQKLTTSGSGETIWSDIGELKNIASYTQNGSWSVPLGVTKIIIEAWGAGGGGASGGGGSGGTYIRTSTLNVTPSGTVTITIGTGGLGASSEFLNGANGSSTDITGSFGSFTAFGGTGATSSRGGYAGSFILTGNLVMQLGGQAGVSTTFMYAQRSTTQFVEIRNFGCGGGVAPSYNNGGPGGCYVKDLSTSNNVVFMEPVPFLKIAGIGGGGGFSFAGTGLWGVAGASGMVIIHY